MQNYQTNPNSERAPPLRSEPRARASGQHSCVTCEIREICGPNQSDPQIGGCHGQLACPCPTLADKPRVAPATATHQTPAPSATRSPGYPFVPAGDVGNLFPVAVIQSARRLAIVSMTLFDFFRSTLVVLVMSYCTIKLSLFVWNWQAGTMRADRRERLLRRYLETGVLRVRLRRFWLDFLQIASLAAVLWWVLYLHSRGS